MDALSTLIEKEVSYFKKLHQDAQKLILSILLYNLISPLIGIFLNAFLWRQTHDIVLIALYNVIIFLTIPIGFYTNGVVLRRYPPSIPYTLSLLAIGVATGALMFVPTITYGVVVIFGMVNGVASGMYWANRNLLTLKSTQSADRIYFSSIESSTSSFTDVAVPLLIGWFIVAGEVIHLYTAVLGYRLLIIGMLCIIAAIGIINDKISIKYPTTAELFVKHPDQKWQTFRLLEFILGLKEATVTFIPALLVLILIGNEGTLGTVQAASAIVASVLIFILGKSIKTKDRLKFVSISVMITLIGGIVFSLFYNPFGVFIFFACQALALPFFWVTLNSLNYDLIDQNSEKQQQHFAFVCDQEIFLNSGRVLGILLFIAFVFVSSNNVALRFAPLLFGLTQILLFFTVKEIEKKNSHNFPNP